MTASHHITFKWAARWNFKNWLRFCCCTVSVGKHLCVRFPDDGKNGKNPSPSYCERNGRPSSPQTTLIRWPFGVMWQEYVETSDLIWETSRQKSFWLYRETCKNGELSKFRHNKVWRWGLNTAKRWLPVMYVPKPKLVWCVTSSLAWEQQKKVVAILADNSLRTADAFIPLIGWTPSQLQIRLRPLALPRGMKRRRRSAGLLLRRQASRSQR